MDLTHIIRGADHISNTPKQVLQYQALKKPLPVFAHLPLILGPDKSRLSKRHGATSVLAYQDMGIVPEAFRNFLGLLGWTPGNVGKEIFSSEELIELFSLGGISKSNAVFDNDKLAWFNTEWIRRYSAEELLPLIEQEWATAGFRSDRSKEEILRRLHCCNRGRAVLRILPELSEGISAMRMNTIPRRWRNFFPMNRRARLWPN